jgi:imidazolonepropionase-like amidohydrolase
MQRLSFFAAMAMAAISFVANQPALAQVTTQRAEPLRDNSPRLHALTGATLHIAPGKVIDNGVLILKDGRVAAAGPAASTPVPKGARVWKLDGKSVYPGFIDLASNVGLPANARARAPGAPFTGDGPPPTPQRAEELKAPGARALSSSNRSVRADFDVAANLEIKSDELKAARELGFTTVLAAPQAGVLRGQSALLNTADRADAKSLVVAARVAQHVANEAERGFGSGTQYPNSVMGAIALVRQSFLDAKWHAAATEAHRANPSTERPEPNATLDSLGPVLAAKQPVIYVAEGEQDFQRIGKVRDEFALKVIAQGNGYEYRRRDHLIALKLPVIVPVNFPAPPEVETPDQALDVQLEQLQHWDQAASNLFTLSQANIEFAITAHGVANPAREFWNNMRLAVRRGLSTSGALKALTATPAKLAGVEKMLGTLEPGFIANVVVASGNLFTDDSAEVDIAFVDGWPHVTTTGELPDVRGVWNANGTALDIRGTKARPRMMVGNANCDAALRGRQLVFSLPCPKSAANHTQVVAELIDGRLTGSVQDNSGGLQPWSATRTSKFDAVSKPPASDPVPAFTSTYPAGAYGIVAPAKPAALLVKNATIWTSGPMGKLASADLLVKDGRISAVGKSLSAPGAVEIDATGKHVTPGMIDAHSHTAANGGLNESTSSVTAEVRVADVLDATAISLYRQLAGGTTAANVMHGSANTIGGQTQTIKFRWGADAEGLKMQGALPGIKFALGENVKQSNSQTPGTRYPQTRMGVEQVIRDAFAAAKKYQADWKTWNLTRPGALKTPPDPPPRRDLQLEALVELLEKKRAVHIHSYRADEILMFARVAKELGITVATFQHVLEGYKVADAIRDIGAGGSTFSDWWAYKMEVQDAIPWNGAIMHNVGVLTTFNSDSDELARRLNTEAAKAVRYGKVPETEALKFVTLNAAKQLGIDKQTGSLEPGKDADFVIWSADPLSPLARAEQTWIDGRKYFDLKDDARMAEDAAKEKARLVAKALPARLVRLNAASAMANAGGRGAGAPAAETPPSEVQSMMAYFALQRELHQLNHLRGEYWNGGEWLECMGEGR